MIDIDKYSNHCTDRHEMNVLLDLAKATPIAIKNRIAGVFNEHGAVILILYRDYILDEGATMDQCIEIYTLGEIKIVGLLP